MWEYCGKTQICPYIGGLQRSLFMFVYYIQLKVCSINKSINPKLLYLLFYTSQSLGIRLWKDIYTLFEFSQLCILKMDLQQQRKHLSDLIHIHSFPKTFKEIAPLTNTIYVWIDFVRVNFYQNHKLKEI